jgi:hypothetical protein
LASESQIASINRVCFSQLVFCSKTPPSCETFAYEHRSRCPPMALGMSEISLPCYQSLVTTHAPGGTGACAYYTIYLSVCANCGGGVTVHFWGDKILPSMICGTNPKQTA